MVEQFFKEFKGDDEKYKDLLIDIHKVLLNRSKFLLEILETPTNIDKNRLSYLYQLTVENTTDLKLLNHKMYEFLLKKNC